MNERLTELFNTIKMRAQGLEEITFGIYRTTFNEEKLNEIIEDAEVLIKAAREAKDLLTIRSKDKEGRGK